MSPSTATATATARTESPDTGSRLLEHDSTLIVGRSVSLTLGSDSLAIVGMSSLCFYPFLAFSDIHKWQMSVPHASRIATDAADSSNPVIPYP